MAMGIWNHMERVFRTDTGWWGLIVVSTFLVLIINVYGLLVHIANDLPQLFYLPVILAAYRFPRRGIIVSTGIAVLYLIAVLAITWADPTVVSSAIESAIILVAIGAVVSVLSIQIREQRERYKGLFDNSEAGAFLIRQEGSKTTIVEANYRAARILDMEIRDLEGTLFPQLWEKEVDWEEFFRSVRETGSCYSFETRLKKSGGDYTDVLLSAGRIDAGQFIVSMVDITSLRQSDDALRAANRELNLLSRILQTDLLAVTGDLTQTLTGAGSLHTGETADLFRRFESSVRYLQRRLELTGTYQDLGSEPAIWLPVQITVRAEALRIDHAGISIRAWTERLEIYTDRLATGVFYHLFDNAVRHGKNATDIVVTYRISGDGVDIIVEDNGLGIPEDQKERIFTYGAETPAWLRLFVDRKILAVTGITITETGRYGDGARFEIHVPRGAFRIV